MTKYKISTKVSVYSLISYALFIAIVKPYFLPDAVRQIVKIMILVGVLLFTITRLKTKKLLNISLLFCMCVLISSLVAIFRDNYQFRDFLDSILYALTFYDLYTFAELCSTKGCIDVMMRSIYRINLICCLLTLISVTFVGTGTFNSNQAVYFFGNKFASTYLFIFLIAMFGATHQMSEKKNKIIFYLLIIFSVLFSLYVGCATVAVTLIILFILSFLPHKFKHILLNEKCVVVALIMSALILLWIQAILNLEFVDRIVTGYFNKSYTITGRLEIYGVYIAEVIKQHFWIGYGYSNSVLTNLTGMYSNAQNGLLEMFVNFGLLGIIALIITVYHCYKTSSKNDKVLYLSLAVYGLIIAAIFEVSLNWFFFLALVLVKWNCDQEKSITRRRLI